MKLPCVQVANYLVDRLGKKCVTAELLQPDELISGMISQVAAEPEMALLLNHFIYSTHGKGSTAMSLNVLEPEICCCSNVALFNTSTTRMVRSQQLYYCTAVLLNCYGHHSIL